MRVEQQAAGHRETCHRCGVELPPREAAGEAGFFCSHCGAPQILLPEHMRMEGLNTEGLGAAMGSEPVALTREIHWRSALRYGGLVALVGGVLTGGGLVSGVVSFLSFLWVVSGGVIVLSLYQKRRPAARMSGRVGLRIGLVAGVLMTFAIAAALASMGVVARFGIHRMSEFDRQVESFQGQITVRVQEQAQGQNKDASADAARLLSSPEVHAGLALLDLAFLGALLTVLSAGGGAFAGLLGTRRQRARGVP